MTHIAEQEIRAPSQPRRAARRRKTGQGRELLRCRDKRWPALAAALAGLRAAKRRSVRIVDADCGAGRLLLCAVRHARALGFTSIEARGIDAAPSLVDRARAAAAVVRDPAIGITFEAADLIGALSEESDFPADIVVWHGGRGKEAGVVANAIACAGRLLIADPARAAA